MPKPKVFVTRKIPAIGLQMLAEHTDVQLHAGEMPPTRAELLRSVRGCAAVLSLLSDRIDGEVFDSAGEALRVVSNFAVGVNNIDLAEAQKRGIAVGNTPDVLTDATADVAVLLVLAAARRMREAMTAVGQGHWKTWEPLGWIGVDLRGKTLGIVGMGRIGAAVARRLHGGWNMRVVYSSRNRKSELESEFGGEHVPLDELLRQSDFVSLHVPLNDTTREMISDEQLHLMKPGAVLVNTARGEIINQVALEGALRDQRIFAAGLDVCTPEPLPPSDPLLSLPNCVVLPHIGSATHAARNAMAERAANNILAGIAGQPLPYGVNFTN